MKMVQVIILFLLSGLPWGQAGAERVHKKGSISVENWRAFDLDEGASSSEKCIDCDYSGLEPAGFIGSDFWFEAFGKRRYLHSQHKARFSKGIATNAGYAGCAAATYVRGRVRVDDLPTGATFCMRTNEGRYAEIRIESYDAKAKILKFLFTTWEKEKEAAVKK